jgi:excisionase family DNA binding protein
MRSRKLTAATLRGYPDLMTPEDARKILRIGRSKMYSLLNSGQISALRIGAKYRIPKAYLIDFLNENA